MLGCTNLTFFVKLVTPRSDCFEIKFKVDKLLAKLAPHFFLFIVVIFCKKKGSGVNVCRV